MRRLVLLIGMAALVAGCATGSFARGEQASRIGDWDAAVEFYRTAVQEDPNRAEFRIALERAMINAANTHLDQARVFEARGQLEEALREYRRASEYDPTNRQAAARVQIELLGAALDQFKLDVGRYPNTQESLQALQQSPGNAPGWEGPYLKKDVPRDPWGNPYQYRSPGEHGEYDLSSFGSDGVPGGDGEASDVTSWGTEGKAR